MKTKIGFFTLMFMLVTSLAFAQTNINSNISFGILGGVNFQNLNGKDMSGDKLDNNLIIGYHVGFNAQIGFAPEFYFQPGLMFSTKGGESEHGAITTKFKLSYIELPLNIVYKAQLGSGYFMLGFGPYLAYGIGGKTISKGGPVTVESDIEFKNEVEVGDPLTTTYFKPFDAGGNIFFGYEMAGGPFIQLNAQLGMLNISPDDKRSPDNDSSVKNTGYGFSLGYRF